MEGFGVFRGADHESDIDGSSLNRVVVLFGAKCQMWINLYENLNIVSQYGLGVATEIFKQADH